MKQQIIWKITSGYLLVILLEQYECNRRSVCFNQVNKTCLPLHVLGLKQVLQIATQALVKNWILNLVLEYLII